MPHVLQLEKRLLFCRIAVWMSALCVAILIYRSEFPMGWQAAAFGVIFAAIWSRAKDASSKFPFILSSKKKIPASRSMVNEFEDLEAKTRERITLRKIDVGMDVAAVTMFIHYTGGFSSPFAPLLFFCVFEGYALLGTANASYTALIAALLSLIHLNTGLITRNAAVLYGFATATLILSAVFIGWNQMLTRYTENTPNHDGDLGEELKRTRTATGLLRSKQVLEQQLEDLEGSHRQLRSTYKEVALLHRKQKSQIDNLRAAGHLLETAVSAPVEHSQAAGAFSALLHEVVDLMDAGGGAIWLYSESSDTMQVRAALGKGSELLRTEIIHQVSKLSLNELKTICERQLVSNTNTGAAQEMELLPEPFSAVINAAILDSSLEVAVLDSSLESTVEIEEEEEADAEESTEHNIELDYESSLNSIDKLTINPTSLVVLRETRTEGNEFGALVGIVGISEPRGAIHYNASDNERLQNIAAPLVVALNNIEQRRNIHRKLRETSLLYEMSQLMQSATDIKQVYQAILDQVRELVTCENCTLFMLDKTSSFLEEKASAGNIVNLLSHYIFEKGKGISGWVASSGRQLVIPDLKRETNLLNIEMIPPRIRSFVAIPLKVHGNVIGVISVSHSQPNAFNAEEIQLMNTLGVQAAFTIERTETFHAMELLAITDGLTQCYNHRYFEMRLDDELRRCKRYDLNLSMIMVDVDNFKSINDHYGHATGDAVIQQLGALLRKSVRDTEIVARYGGDEFALILPQTTCDQALIAAERIRANVDSSRFLAADGHVTLRVTVSLGVSHVAETMHNRVDLLEATDKALYAAKRGGRNRVQPNPGTPDARPLNQAVVSQIEAKNHAVDKANAVLV